MSERLSTLVDTYLTSENVHDELEVKFGTKHRGALTRIDFDNIIRNLKSKGFTSARATGAYRLTIQSSFTDVKSGAVKMSNIRIEIPSLSNIKKFCETNRFDVKGNAGDILVENLPKYITFTQKRRKYIGNKVVRPVDFDDFNFRLDLKEENNIPISDRRVKSMLREWDNSKKNYRFIKRFTFTHKDYPLKVDCSIVKTSKIVGGHMLAAYTIQDSNLFSNPEHYEIEIEINSLSDIKQYEIKKKDIVTKMRKAIRIILGGWQRSNYPIAFSEQTKILQNYMKLIHGRVSHDSRIRPKDFVGPSSISLEMGNIISPDPELKTPNIRDPYTLTDKADGLRKLLFINSLGRVYLLTTDMKVQFTGSKTANGLLHNSILDGEHVLHNKMGKFINKYLIFDIYFKNREDLRPLPFAALEKDEYSNTRLSELRAFVKELDLEPLSGEGDAPLKVNAKTFHKSKGKGIFINCNKLLSSIADGAFEYETDGLIFTPANTGVASNKIGETPPGRKITWRRSLKWKPPQFNTIDFLITTKKTATGQEFVGNIFETGEDMSAVRQIVQYKTIILRVGYDERKHGYLNPCQDIIEGKYPSSRHDYNNDHYKPAPFYPTNPSDPNAAICNIKIKQDIYGNSYMLTENQHETFEDNMIVEFRYDRTREDFWRWIPIRVRYDKTAEYRQGIKNYGNAFHVAQSVWQSIHNPITSEMLKTGKGIPDELADDNVYYRRSGATNTRALRDFHNLYVKRLLISTVAERGGTLIDLAVGKAGDLPKWIHSHLSFILGIDISKDNIENRKDGACARYLNYRKRFRSMPDALFIEGNSSLNIRNGSAAATTSGGQILRAILGQGEKDAAKLGRAVYKQYGKGKNGFDVVSCQFATHYFFENQTILQNFIRNISENCVINGYFIGTCYDGDKIFEALENKKVGEGIGAAQDEKKLWEITKQYSSDTFENNATSVGYAINVYQESINKVFREYLVNFAYLSHLLEIYGFSLVTPEEARKLGMPNATGLFSELFTYMERQLAEKKIRSPDIGRAAEMTPKEKRVSFYNRYFMFKKHKHVETDKILQVMIGNAAASTEHKQLASKKKRKQGKKPKKISKRINIESIQGDKV